jgi:D-alanyl-D-alanine carboxypeptidase
VSPGRDGQTNKRASASRLLAVGLLVGVLVLCTSAARAGQEGPIEPAGERARGLLDEALARSVTDEDGTVRRNAVLHIHAPAQRFTYAGAAGVARADTGEPMTPDHQWFIASVGKAMTAVIVLQLWEEGAFGEEGLDATLEELQPFPPEVLDALHNFDGESHGREITVRHLLNHTSGLRDYDDDSETGLGQDYPQFGGFAPGSLAYVVAYDETRGFEAMMRCVEEGIPQGCALEDYCLSRTWPHWDYEAWVRDPADGMAGLLNYYLSGSNRASLWAPGEGFYYADTNYLILALLIEDLTGKTLHQEHRTRIFEPLGMHSTYVAYSTLPPASLWEEALSDLWSADTPLISNGVNLSMDWGGGGQVSTARELSVFMRALADGRLFSREETLAEMLTPPGEVPYGAGIVALRSEDGLILWHGGSSGSWIEYHTGSDLTVVGTVNEMGNDYRHLVLRGDVYGALQELGLTSALLKTVPVSTRFGAALTTEPPQTWALLAICLLILLSACVVWPVSALSSRRACRSVSAFTRTARCLALAAIAVHLLVVSGFGLVAAADFAQYTMLFGFTSGQRALLALALLGAVLTAPLPPLALLAWTRKEWPVAVAIHYGLVALAALWVTWILGRLHLLTLQWL